QGRSHTPEVESDAISAFNFTITVQNRPRVKPITSLLIHRTHIQNIRWKFSGITVTRTRPEWDERLIDTDE
uniref:Uncharacterized protein n=1 Tax=Parascaris equorum TaxID=6256 RepID=A0A914R1G2_PAREQ